MSRLLLSSEENWVRLKNLGALLGRVTVEDNYEKAGNRICTILKIGLVEMRISLVLDVVVALPPSRILAVRPCVPRLESEIIPSDQNFLGCNLSVSGNARSVIIDVASLCRTFDVLAYDLS
jgi:hypothetical protein